ncbi:hypothetical protein BVN1_16000 [Bacillus velezensis]|nr:hypothetical protein BVN1_16000 [Bacillus velezensis]
MSSIGTPSKGFENFDVTCKGCGSKNRHWVRKLDRMSNLPTTKTSDND